MTYSSASGPSLWLKAKQLIPGGNMLLSKRSEMFLPELWPSYFSKSKGYNVWDLDNNKYIDMSIMGIGTNSLGYSYEPVDNAVFECIRNGNLSTLNCPEEVYLAEQLVSLHPWSDMARFARSGGEANSIAIRIARAATGRDKVAICGYHGWHDWYLSVNLADQSGLSKHLLPGLAPNGVPKNLKDTVFPFNFNNIEQLKQIVSQHSLAAVKMEVQRSEPPAPGFLESVRKLCDENGIALIFDECTSGFRETYGGLHLKYGVFPDMAMFGKALGNGYAITAIIGSRSVMQAAQTTFISSTFWTERIGPTAALSTLCSMKSLQSWQIITDLGQLIINGWEQIASAYNVKINVTGLPSLATFSFLSQRSLEYKTYLTQEMLKEGYLASNAFYASTAHNPEVIRCYLSKLEPIFSLISKCENDLENIEQFLDGPVCHSGFKRLN